MTTANERKEWKDRAKEDPNLVYYEYMLDSLGTGGLGPSRRETSIGVMTSKEALKLQEFMAKLRREGVDTQS